VRIIGGQHRGLALASVGKGDAAAHLRPTSDRVRESLFNVLQGGRYGDPITVVDSGRAAQKLIRENISKCRRQADTTLLSIDITRLPPATTPCTLIFADPPYGKGLGAAALAQAQTQGWIAPDALIVLEDNSALPPPPGFTTLDQRRYGDTWITLLEPAS